MKDSVLIIGGFNDLLSMIPVGVYNIIASRQ